MLFLTFIEVHFLSELHKEKLFCLFSSHKIVKCKILRENHVCFEFSVTYDTKLFWERLSIFLIAFKIIKVK